MKSRAILLALLATGLACGRTAEDTGKVATAAPPPGTLALGARITSPLVPLAAIAKEPARYVNQVIATSGKVTSVCRERGCWLELQDATGSAHVKLHGHSFFVPKTAPGHVARVQATVLGAQGQGAEDCEEQPGAAAGLAKVELDATGVEID